MSPTSPIIAFLDANVLYGSEMRNFLMRLATADAFSPRWTAKVQDEWGAALAKNRPDITPAQIAKIRGLMERHVIGAIVTDYEPLIEQLKLPDPDDRHVLAAAITSQASILVTINLSDFPAATPEPHGIEALHPDDFVMRLVERDIAPVVKAAKAHRASLRNPAKTAAEYIASLERNEFLSIASVLRIHETEI